MSVRLTYDIGKNEWSEIIAPETPEPVIEIGVKGGEYNGLKFGFVAISGGNMVANVNYPPQGVTYVSSDQLYLTAYKLTGATGSVSLFFWLENAGVRSQHNVNIELPEIPDPQ